MELTPFQRVIGVDPSAKMIEQASHNADSAGFPGQITYQQSPAERLSFLGDGSIDLVTSGPQRCRMT